MTQSTSNKQERAQKAYHFVSEASKDTSLNHNEYKQYIKKLPMMIYTNGLSASLAFVFSKGSPAYKKIYEQIGNWLQEKQIIKAELIKEILELDSINYRVATNEVLALLEWMKRFADGMLKEDTQQDKDEK
ncbi:MAG: type III-B CRISPR module-associated protein Cmr5 [Leptospiraceae bacterium]|nr:type III-B CRISPR module-associated protein Cmr5 [Leptospiraceae bacterium]